jgi:Mce-associated membrane protein
VTRGPHHYDVLDVDPSASTDEIRDAWRAAIAELTPADRRFRLFNQAAEVLLDPERRAAYDAELAAQAEDRSAEEPLPGPAPTDAPSSAPAGWWVPNTLLAGVGLLALVSVALASYLFLTQPSGAAVEEAAASARSAAERAVVPVLSYDHETLDEDQQAAHRWLTPDQAADYDDLFEVIRQNAPSTRTVVDVEVISSAVVRAGEERTEVLLFVNRPTTNKAHREPVVYKDQVTVTMELVDGEWLVDDLRTSPVAS